MQPRERQTLVAPDEQRPHPDPLPDTRPARPRVVVLSRRGVVRVLVAAIVAVNVGNAVSLLPGVWEEGGRGWLLLANENNPSSWLSAGMLALGGALFALVGFGGARPASERRAWAALAVLMLWLSLDEVASMHERFGPLVSPGNAPWVVPGAILLVFVGIVAWRFLARVDRSLLRWCVAAGALFGSGSLGVEMIGRQWGETRGQDWGLCAIATVEENLEMAGALVLVAGVLHFASRTRSRVTVVAGEHGDRSGERGLDVRA